jgi:hypothetical protein
MMTERSVGRLLHRLEMTRLQPRPYHPKKDAAAQEAFKKRARIGAPACGGRNWPRYPGSEGSGRKVFGGCDPVKKRGPWAVADLRVVTLSGDPV